MNRADLVQRLPRFLDRGFVVSLGSGIPRNQGDSLFFSGLALYALDIDEGQPIADALVKMLTDLDGGTYRHPDRKDEVSLDGLLGMYRGIAKRIRYFDEGDLWRPLLAKHQHKTSLPGAYSLIPDTIYWQLGLGQEPCPERFKNLIKEAVNWTERTRQARLSAYRIHLNLLALQTMSELSAIPSMDLLEHFSIATNGLEMRTIDHFLGRPGLLAYLDSFVYNQWQYAHQRCVLWETPDGASEEHPGLDYLVGWADYYGSPK